MINENKHLCYFHECCPRQGRREFEEVNPSQIGGGGGSRTRVRKCYWSEAYMRSHVPASGITQRRSRPPLRTDKKRMPLACRSRLLHPDVAEKASPLCDALPQPTGKAAEDGYLTN